MRVTVPRISPPRKPGALASATVELTLEGHTLVIADWRVLRNRTGELWVAPPSYAVEENGARRYENTLTASRALAAEITGAVLDAFEKWSHEQQAVRQ